MAGVPHVQRMEPRAPHAPAELLETQAQLWGHRRGHWIPDGRACNTEHTPRTRDWGQGERQRLQGAASWLTGSLPRVSPGKQDKWGKLLPNTHGLVR